MTPKGFQLTQGAAGLTDGRVGELALQVLSWLLGHWLPASTDAEAEPDVIMGCAGDVPTMETRAAVEILRTRFPDLQIRVVNVVDLMRLQDRREYSHGLSGQDFNALFTADKPVISAYHGYPWLIHRPGTS